ncbi:MAG: SMEK domain-containing protein [Nostoc sp.]|uniref:SMEK domain-containing protein n=1 Tax=Nostoc sp. TaxID=1180 RepID=UPI002FF4EBD3
MHLEQTQQRIRNLMSFFVTEIKAATAMEKTDINKVSENVLIPLFAEIYGFENLKNLNFTEGSNFPGIDLGDETAKVAFQITATPHINKIKHTLNKFIEYELYKKYDRLIIYVLLEKQNSYSNKEINKIIQGKLNFNPKQDILDYCDVLKAINQFQIEKALSIQTLLEANFGTGKMQVESKELVDVSQKKLNSELEETLKLYFTKCFEDDEFAELDQAGETDPERRTLLEQIFIDLDIKIRGEKPINLRLEDFPESTRRKFLYLEEADDIPF